MRKNEKDSSWTGWRKTNLKRKRNKGEIEIEGKTKLMSVLFIQHTPKSELAKRVRVKLENLEKVGNLKFKVVEKTGNKLEEILHKSDSWSDRDCERPDCLLCSSVDENGKMGMCKRRNVVYEIYCITCYEKERRQKEEKDIYKITVEENGEKIDTETKKRKRILSESKK